MRPSRVAAVCSLLFTLSASSAARAQRTGTETATAEALFEEGKRLMAAGRHEAACPKFAESLRLDVGLGTMLWLADCYDKNGQAASAWTQFRDAEALAMRLRDPRAKLAHEEAVRLEPKLSRLVVAVPASGDSEAVEVKRNGVVLPRALWGIPVPTDAGQHRITVTAPGKQLWESVAVVPSRGGASVTVKVPALAAVGAEPLAPADGSNAAAESATDSPAAPVDSAGRTQRIVGIVSSGAGIVGLGVGAFFGLRVAAKNDESKENCAGNRCNQLGFDARQSALDAATVSTIAFIAGGALLAGGVVLYLTAPRGRASSLAVGPMVGAAEGGGAIYGRW